MKIEVTKDDIMCGKRKSAHRCPVARAIKRICPIEVADVIAVATRRLYVDTKETPLPREVGWRIDAYDEGEPMMPFSFELPDDVFEPEAKEEVQ